MQKAFIGLLFCVWLVACSTPATPLTAQQVIERWQSAGLTLSDIIIPARDVASPLPNSYSERVEFTIASVAPNGGQVFTCTSKQNCDAIYQYFDALKGLGGPYYYQSPSGLVVVQLNSGLTPEEAAKFEQVVKSLP
jgi:hypothetical protein